jgi:4-hydroxy-2-oxoheptanedioate aldolase
MPAPINSFKQAIQTGDRTLFGLWVAFASPHAAEVSAGSGFDWILIDAEHGPNDIPLLATQLAAVSRHPAHPMVRLPAGETWMIKQALDIGAQSLLIPMVETGEEALRLSRACRYPPFGIRGMGAGLGRASDFGRIGDYVATADEQICLIVQIESQLGIANAEAIVTTEGVDGVLIGPADLAADMGHTGNSGHPDVMAAVDGLIRKIVGFGKPAGIMTTDPAMIRLARDAGACFIAVGSDVGLLAKGAANLLAESKAL